ncbi:MAG TPA: hypothetical protein PKV82_05345, partial [Anaerolineae bacterium]|nr:hypothetical protein [Anaerolineae bacterium]
SLDGVRQHMASPSKIEISESAVSESQNPNVARTSGRAQAVVFMSRGALAEHLDFSENREFNAGT